jgi:hypothetical protein
MCYCALAGLIAPMIWGIISLLPGQYPFVPLAASKTFELVTVTLWPWFLITAIAPFIVPWPVAVYVASALTNAVWYAVVGELLWIVVHRYHAARSAN